MYLICLFILCLGRAGRLVRLIRLIRITRIYKQTQEIKRAGKNFQFLSRKEKIQKKFQNMHSNKNEPALQNQMNTPPHNSKDTIESKTKPFLGPISQTNLSSKINESPNQQECVRLLPQYDYFIYSGFQDKPIPQIKTGNKESRVSKRLSDLTTKRVMIILLILLFIMPLFSKSFYFDIPLSNDYHILALSQLSYLPECTQLQLKNSTIKIIKLLQNLKQPLIYFTQPFKFDQTAEYYSPDYNNLRNSELIASFVIYDKNLFMTNKQLSASDAQKLLKDDDLLVYESVMSIRDQVVLSATLSLSRTLFICIVLTTSSFFFSKDTNELALGPIERMLTKVNQIANDPLSAKDQELIDEEQDQFETRIIENAIIKIGALLALGFGEAGTEIIGSNIAKHGDVDPMISGKKKCAIYGFCDIRNFTDATEVLQEDVMIFVNNIGEIVHSIVDRFNGAANKNIGDAFLLVWKFQEGKYEVKEDNTIEFYDIQYASIMAEFSLLSFMKIQAKINREPLILQYRKDPRLNKRMANYKVKIGFGLHIGWSIEGAIGSEFKIDASYLSPNVSMAARLEGATKGYGVPLLFSSELHKLITPSFQRYARQVDYVRIKGQLNPIGFYTIDMNIDNLPTSKQQDLSIEEKMDIEKNKKQITLQFIESNFFDVETYISNDKDLRLLLLDFDLKFTNDYKQAFESYIQGNWQRSKQLFDAVLKIRPDDGPIKTTMRFMSESNFVAPAEWQGHKPFND